MTTPILFTILALCVGSFLICLSALGIVAGIVIKLRRNG